MHVANPIKSLSVFWLILLIFVISLAISFPLAQEARSGLDGRVQNTDKEAIRKAKIQLKHKESAQIFYSESNKKGEFSFGSVPPGNYTLTVEKEGYKSYRGELELRPNIIRKIGIILVKKESSEQKMEKDAISYFNKGVKLIKEKKPEEAIQAFKEAVELKPDFAEAYLNLGILLFQLQKDDEAEKAVLKSLELNPEESESKIILADINFEQAKAFIRENKLDEAIEKLKQAYSFRPDHAYVNYLLGYLYFKKEMREEAIKYFETFLQLEPNAPQAKSVKKLLTELKKK